MTKQPTSKRKPRPNVIRNEIADILRILNALPDKALPQERTYNPQQELQLKRLGIPRLRTLAKTIRYDLDSTKRERDYFAGEADKLQQEIDEDEAAYENDEEEEEDDDTYRNCGD